MKAGDGKVQIVVTGTLGEHLSRIGGGRRCLPETLSTMTQNH
jgi:hypothetical protein